eukprot:4572268-Pyramimonas_sp.AAC.1
MESFMHTLTIATGGHPTISTMTCCNLCSQRHCPCSGCRRPSASRTNAAAPPDGTDPAVRRTGMRWAFPLSDLRPSVERLSRVVSVADLLAHQDDRLGLAQPGLQRIPTSRSVEGPDEE